MNAAIERMFRIRCQREGRKQEQPIYPANPPGWEATAHPGFAYQIREEQNQRENYFMPPAFDPNELVELPTSWKPDSELDPIPQSNFFAEGNKIRPWAHVRVPSYIAIPEWETPTDDEFREGKIVMGQLVAQHTGGQQPIGISPLIPEVEYTTYGTQNMLTEGMVAHIPTQDGYLFD